jgi:hypothetical protein
MDGAGAQSPLWASGPPGRARRVRFAVFFAMVDEWCRICAAVAVYYTRPLLFRSWLNPAKSALMQSPLRADCEPAFLVHCFRISIALHQPAL